jgi:DNA-binding GntR family transcriptional regulator
MIEDEEVQVSLAQEAYQQIEGLIVTRALKPGVIISEIKLAEEVGYGRTPVREAIQRLRLEGYVEIHRRRGIQVSSVDIFRQFELLEVRRPLENLMVHLAAERATHAEREIMTKLSATLAAAAKKRDLKAYLTANRSIHETLVKASHNSILVNSLRVVHGLSRRFWHAMIEEENAFEEAARLHGKTLAATAARDTDAATKHAEEFLDFLERLTRKKLDERVSRT